MILNHRFVVPVGLDEAWAAFNQVEDLVPCMPGARLVSSEGESFVGEVKIKLGPISMLYGGTGTFLERDQATGRMVLEAKGKDKRGNGTAGATVTAQLTADGDGTAVDVTTDLSVTGKPAQFGRGVIQDVSDKLLGQFVDCLSAKLSPAPTSAEGGESGTSSPPDAAADTEPARSAGPVHTQPPAPRGAGTPSGPAQPGELNLLSTVMPVFLRRFAVPVGIAFVAMVTLWLCRRRR